MRKKLAAILFLAVFMSNCASFKPNLIAWKDVAPVAIQAIATVIIEEAFFPEPVSVSGGTAFAISPDGVMVTNFHVVDAIFELKKPQIVIKFQDGQTFFTEKLMLFPEFDLAIMKINVRSIPYFDIEESELTLGEEVLSLGNSYPLTFSISEGIVSNLDREVPKSFGNYRWFQMTAIINPGCSGGPIINKAGKVVGINNAIPGYLEGISLAIPVRFLTKILKEKLSSKDSPIFYSYED